MFVDNVQPWSVQEKSRVDLKKNETNNPIFNISDTLAHITGPLVTCSHGYFTKSLDLKKKWVKGCQTDTLQKANYLENLTTDGVHIAHVLKSLDLNQVETFFCHVKLSEPHSVGGKLVAVCCFAGKILTEMSARARKFSQDKNLF